MSSRSFPAQPVSRFSSRSRSQGPSDEVGGRRRQLPASPSGRPQGLPSAARPIRPDASRVAPASATSSSSSSGSSLLDRMKAPSSRTSLEDNSNNDTPRRRTYERSGESLRRKVQNVRGGDEDEEEVKPIAEAVESISGYGYELWGRVTSVASKLTVNVNQAWQKSVRLADGEETPPGEESRLTKALKAYYLERARSPADLPAWLFEDYERGVGSRTWNVKQSEDIKAGLSLPTEDHRTGPPTQRGALLRDVYDGAAARSPAAFSASRKRDNATENTSTRATDRLRAIRDAKHLAAQSASSKSEVLLSDGHGSSAVTADLKDDRNVVQPPRIGLPSGPKRLQRS